MVIINGQRFDGNNVSIINGVVVIDGNTTSLNGLSGVVKIEVQGNLTSLKTDASVTVNGSVLGDVSCGGSLHCGDVGGSASSGGSVKCDKVGGSLNAGGSVRIG